MKNRKSSIATLVLSLGMFAAGAAFTGAAHAQTFVAVRGSSGSDRNVARVRAGLQGLIDQLARDQHDYGGHRVAAINLMRQARGELGAAIAWDRGH